MKLFTLQPQEVVSILQSGETLICDPEKATFLQDEPYLHDFRKAYDWLVLKMKQKISKPDNVSYPLWAWYKTYGENKKPDRRKSLFRDYDHLDTILELEVPETKVFLTDFDDWHYVINNFPYQTDEDYEKNPDWNPSQAEKEKSWDVVFDLENKNFIQACLWEIKPEEVIKYHSLRKR